MNINNTFYTPIPHFEGYFISRTGSVYSSISNKILKTYKNRKNYLCIDLVQNGKRIKCRIHSLVALTFIGERPLGMQVRHLDGNPLNNSPENLAYGTQSDNEQDSVRHGTHYRNCKISPTIARLIAKDTRPYKQIAKEFSISPGTVSDIKCGILWSKETVGLRFQRGRHNEPYNKRKFTPEETQFIADKNNPRSVICNKFGISTAIITRIRAEVRRKKLSNS